ncbi:MAG: zinc-dependent metalloprotease [Bacteroidota bacterium]
MKQFRIDLILLLLIVYQASLVAQNQLYEDFTGALTVQQSAILAQNLASVNIKQNKTILIKPSIFRERKFSVRLLDNQDILLAYDSLDFSGVNQRTWTGKLPNGLGSGAFVINGDRISGHISGTFGNYEIYPLGDGIHIFSELDNEQFGECGNRADEQNIAIPETVPLDYNTSKDIDYEKSAIGTECFIRLIVAYTGLAQTNTNNVYGRTMNEHVALAVTETNQGYASSNVEMRVELAYLYETGDNETTNSIQDVNDFQSSTDGKWDEVHTERNNYDGDMLCLVTGGQYSFCGRAFAFDYTDDANMFNVSEYSCIVGNYTFAHEFGHTQGCRHDNDNTGSPFSYARGYDDGNQRSIMAVANLNNPRRNQWSNPDVNFPNGNMSGTSTRDNARALDFGDFTVARHRTTPSFFTTSRAIETDETLNMYTTNTLTSNNDVKNGARLELKSKTRVAITPGFHAVAGSRVRAYIVDDCTASYSIDDDSMEDRSAILNDQSEIALSIVPNPVSSKARIQLNVKEEQSAEITVINAYGKIVKLLARQSLAIGQNTINLELAELPNGLYYITVKLQDHQLTKALVISKS